MKTFAEWFDAGFCINLDHRADRWDQSRQELEQIGLKGRVHRFPGYHKVKRCDGSISGNAGCTASHRGVLEIIAFFNYHRALVLEDDFARVHPIENFNQYWSEIQQEIPADWDLIYLGGHYGEAPKYRVSKHIIRCNSMLTTSSYIVNGQMARIMAPYIYGDSSIDNLIGSFAKDHNCYIVQPRLFVQRDSFSDIQERYCENRHCMLDSAHENMV